MGSCGILAALLLCTVPTTAAWVASATDLAQPLVCDGEPPRLINRDNREHAILLECGKKSESRQIRARETISLRGKSGCLLRLGGRSVTLYADLTCTIQNTVLSCELSESIDINEEDQSHGASSNLASTTSSGQLLLGDHRGLQSSLHAL